MSTNKVNTQNTEVKISKAEWKHLLHLWENNMPAATRSYAEELLISYPKDSGILLVLAETLISLAQYEEAKCILTKLLKRKSSRLKSLTSVYMGDLYRAKGKYKNAEHWYRKSLGFESRGEIWIYLGTILAKQGQFDEAKQCHQKATRIKSANQDEAHLNLGFIYRAEGKFKLALKHFDKAIEINPKYTKAKQARKDILQAMKISK